MAKSKVVVTNNTPKVLQAVTGLVGNSLVDFTEKAVLNIKVAAPVDTGNHRGTIRSEKVGRNSARVFSESGYGGFLEFGTSKMAAQPHFKPGLLQTIDEWQQAGKWR